MPQNIKQATKKALHQEKVASINSGVNKGDYETDKLSVIESICGDFIQRVLVNLDTEDMIVTGGIADIQLEADETNVNITANNYLIYQDRGVNGSEKKLYNTIHSYTDKMPPVEVFENWIRRKNLNLLNNEKKGGKPSEFKEVDEDKLINKAAWGMAKKVFKEGFKPRNVYTKEIPKLVDDLQQEIADFTMQYISQNIDVKDSAKRII